MAVSEYPNFNPFEIYGAPKLILVFNLMKIPKKLKPLQNKKDQKSLRYPTKKQSFSGKKTAFFGPSYFEQDRRYSDPKARNC